MTKPRGPRKDVGFRLESERTQPSAMGPIGMLAGGATLCGLGLAGALPWMRAESELFALLGATLALVGVGRLVLCLGGSGRLTALIIVAVVVALGLGTWWVIRDQAKEDRAQADEEALIFAALTADLDTMRATLDAGGNANAHEDNMTVLIAAVNSGSSEAVGLLLERGADPNGVSPSGMTPLATAVVLEHVDLAKRLLDAGADPDAPSKHGTPRQLSVDHEAMRALLSR